MPIGIKDFKLSSFNELEQCSTYLKLFKLDKLLGVELSFDINKTTNNVDPDYKVPYGIEIHDLCRLHWICLSRKTTQVLEFGSGFSTLVFAHAMQYLRVDNLNWAKLNTRLDNPFKVYSIEESSKFAKITMSRLDDYKEIVDIHISDVNLTEINGRFVTLYETLPNVFPDFIYLDGPSQYATEDSIAGFSISKKFRMPMAADLLRIEYFLEPGAIILVDGRSANAAMLKNNFQRNWKYLHDSVGDFHLFELQDKFLGKLNLDKFNYCTNGTWLLD